MERNFIDQGDSPMNSRFFTWVSILCLALLVVSSMGVAQNQRVGTTAAPWITIPTGARDLAIGGASLATTSGLEAVHWNPAGVGHLSSSAEGMFSSMSYIADINLTYAAVAGSFGDFGNIAFSIKSLNIGEIPITSETDPEGITGRSFTPTFVSVGLTYARGITDAISFGVTTKIISESIDRVSASAVAFDVGIQYHSLVGIQGFNLGLAIKNVGTEMKYDGSGLYRFAQATNGTRSAQYYKSEAASAELPATVELGLSYEGRPTENIRYEVGGAYCNDNLYYDEYRVGGEVSYSMPSSLKLFGRFGMRTLGARTEDDIYGASYGFGIGYNFTGIAITVDYAIRSVDLFDDNQIVSVKLGF
jgi:hypothetical protein